MRDASLLPTRHTIPTRETQHPVAITSNFNYFWLGLFLMRRVVGYAFKKLPLCGEGPCMYPHQSEVSTRVVVVRDGLSVNLVSDYKLASP